MTKNIIVCCDGTANEFSQDRTNVAKLCYAVVKDPVQQLVYYHPGVGTMAPPGFVTRSGAFLARLLGLAFGYGLKNDIRDAYAFIMNHYEPGDRLFLFGFSRGAYTVRVVAALLHLYGLTMKGNEALIPYAVQMLWAIAGMRGKNPSRVTEYFGLAADYKATLAGPPCKPHFLGVWDTVSSVGWIGSPVALPFTKDNPDIAIVRHAVSIDDHRADFRTNLVKEDGNRDIKQVWFPGVHCDVGGGYPEAQSGLSKIALKWMMEEAEIAGLQIDPARRDRILGCAGDGYAKPASAATMHNSLSWLWWPAEFVPKRYWDRLTQTSTWRFNRFRRRSMGARPCVHDAAWERGEIYAKRLPEDAVRLSQTTAAP